MLGPRGACDAAKEPATPAKGSPKTSKINGSRTLDAIAAAAGANAEPVKWGGVRTQTAAAAAFFAEACDERPPRIRLACSK